MIDARVPLQIKACKSPEGYDYFYNGHVRTVYYYFGTGTNGHCVLKSWPADKANEAWVMLTKTGVTKTAHYTTCMAGQCVSG